MADGSRNETKNWIRIPVTDLGPWDVLSCCTVVLPFHPSALRPGGAEEAGSTWEMFSIGTGG